MATIPAEVAAAIRLLQEPLRFGDLSQIGARKLLEDWQSEPCLYCDGTGYPRWSDKWQELIPDSFLPIWDDIPQIRPRSYPCNPCDGTGKVWTRK